jgi:hypothetical protein
LANHFREQGLEYIQIYQHTGVDITNDPTEQAIRLVDLDRKVTQGTRRVEGRHWCERNWMTIATCA